MTTVIKQMNGYEIACVSSCVPATGDPQLDAIISASLRYRTASAMMEALLARQEEGSIIQDKDFPSFARQAVEAADALIAQFNKPRA